MSVSVHREPARARLRLAAGLCIVLAVQALCWLRWLPGPDGRLGHDWSYFLPRLLAGEYHAAVSGVLDTPWYTPAFGAGLPLAAHPASVWHSLPQWLSFAVGPLAAAQATLLVCTAAACLGMWLFARDVLRTGERAAFAAAMVVALDSFLPSRMVVGHLGFHSGALAPLLAWLLLHPSRRHAACVLGAAAAAACIVMSGNVYGAPSVLLFVLGAAAVAVWRGACWRVFCLRAACAAMLAGLLCSEKLAFAAAFMEHAPRDHYGLPLCGSFVEAATLLARVLVLGPDDALVAATVHGGGKLATHEWEFVVGPVAVAAALCALARTRAPRCARLPAVVSALVLAAVLLLPLVVVVDSQWIRQAALTRGASTLFRAWAVYAPLVAVGAALAIEQLSHARLRAVRSAWIVVAVAAVVCAWRASSSPHDGLYDPARIVAAHEALGEAPPPPIVQVAWMVDAAGKPGLPIGRDDGLAQGVSQLLPYEPLFGYRLERYPLLGLAPGPALEAQDGLLRLRDPSSWIAPDAAGRAVGGRLRADEIDTARRFASYAAVEWPRGPRLEAALWIARIGWGLFALLAFACVLEARRSRRSA